MPPLVTTDNAAIVLIDHQDTTVGWIASQPQATTVNNVRLLARIGSELGVPLLVTSTMEDDIGTNIKDIQAPAPDGLAPGSARRNPQLLPGRRLSGGRRGAGAPQTHPRRPDHRHLPVSLGSRCDRRGLRGHDRRGRLRQHVPACRRGELRPSAGARRHDQRWQPGAFRAVHRLRERARAEGDADQHGRDHLAHAHGGLANGFR